MSSRALVLSPGPNFTRLAAQAAKDLEVDADIQEYGFLMATEGAAIEHARHDLIVAHPNLAEFAREQCAKPTVEIQLTVMEYLAAMQKAKSYGKRLIFLCHPSILEELETVARLCGCDDYTAYRAHTLSEFNDILEQTDKSSDAVLVGAGHSTRLIAERNRQDYVLIETPYKNIYNALLHAKRILESNNAKEIQARRFKQIIDNSQSGIIAFDEDGRVAVCGKPAQQVAGVFENALIGKDRSAPDFPEAIRAFYGDGSPIRNKIVKYNNVSYFIDLIPISIDGVVKERILHFQEVSHVQQLENQTRIQAYSKGFVAKNTFEHMVGKSEAFTREIAKARRFSNTESTILIEGATGTGKELFAQSIHNESVRKNGPFVAINCASLSEALLESELFGYVEGAFTGAKKGGKTGLFELAHNGTIFLDEIGEISKSIQARLLRVLQEREIMRLGGDRIIPIDVRIVAATNESLYHMVLQKKFREDLYFRLNLLNLRIPKLNERKGDLPLLAGNFLGRFSREYGSVIKAFSPGFLTRLEQYAWPGNVRELQNFVEKACIVFSGRTQTRESLAEELGALLAEHVALHEITAPKSEGDSVTVPIDDIKTMQAVIIRELTDRFGGNRQAVADALGLSRVTIWKVLKETEKSVKHAL